jgi:hypothetical protein
MIKEPLTRAAFLSSRCLILSLAVMTIPLGRLAAEAATPQIPWECSNYTDEAQTRCLNAFIERQQEQIGQLEDRLQRQQDLVGQLKGQVERQTAATAQLQQQLAQPPATTALVPQPYIYPPFYAYPPVGVGIYLGRPWIGPGFYGYYGRPYWGPRFFHRHYGRHW